MIVKDKGFKFSLMSRGPLGLNFNVVLFELLQKSEMWAVIQRSGARLCTDAPSAITREGKQVKPIAE